MKYSVEKGLIFADQRRRKKGMSNLFKTFSWMFFSPPSSPPPPSVRACAHSVRPSRTSIPNVLVFSYIHHQGSHDRGSYHLTLFLSRHLGHARTHGHARILSLSRTQCGSYSKSRLLGIPFRRSKGEGEFFSRGHQIAFLIISHFFHFSPTSLFPDPEELISLFDLTNKMMTSVDLYNCRSIQL